MKQITLLLSVLFTTCVYSQDSLQSFNYMRNNITLNGMKVLGSWGIVNLTAGTIGWAGANEGSINKNFYQMNTFWGAINLGVAALGFAGAKKNLQKHLIETEILKTQNKIERIFIINGGLDFAYIGTGIFLRTRGNERNDTKLKGYGSSVILQGIFLLVFDGIMYKLQRTNGNKLRYFLEKNSVTFSGNNIGIIHTL